MHDTIVNTVINIIELKRRLSQVKFKNEQDMIERQIGALELQINEILYELYGIITDKEKKIIEDNLR